MTSPLLTIPEACDVLRVSRWTIYRLIHKRELDTIRIGTRRFVPTTAVQALLTRLGEQGAT